VPARFIRRTCPVGPVGPVGAVGPAVHSLGHPGSEGPEGDLLCLDHTLAFGRERLGHLGPALGVGQCRPEPELRSGKLGSSPNRVAACTSDIRAQSDSEEIVERHQPGARARSSPGRSAVGVREFTGVESPLDRPAVDATGPGRLRHRKVRLLLLVGDHSPRPFLIEFDPVHTQLSVPDLRLSGRTVLVGTAMV
jgi:hypothetical protein